MRRFQIPTIILMVCAFLSQDLGQTREQTTVHTASAAAKGKSDAVIVKYLDLPWGEKTFTSIEKGEDDYYGTRGWPFARLVINVPVHIEDHALAAGNYAIVLTPAKKAQPLSVSVIKLNDDKEFLQPGNIFVEVPPGQTIFSEVANFETVAQSAADHMKVTLESDEKGISMTVLYGNRKFIRLLTVD